MGIINYDSISALDSDFRLLFNGVYSQTQDPFEKCAMRVSSNGSSENYVLFNDFPGMREWKDERVYRGADASRFTIANKDWESSFQVFRNEIEDDRASFYSAFIEGMAQKARRHAGTLVMDAAINGFASTSEYGAAYDGESFFSAAHKLGGGTVSNTTTNPLTSTSFFSAWTEMASLAGSDGKSLGIRPTDLFCGPAMLQTAREIVESPNLVSGGAAIANQLQGLVNLNIVPDLIGAHQNKWFLMDLSAGVKPFIFQERRGIEFNTDMHHMFHKKIWRWGADLRANVGYGMWQYAYGSNA